MERQHDVIAGGPPRRLEDLGVSPGIVEDILLRRVVHETQITMGALAEALSISVGIVEGVVKELRDRKLCEYQGSSGRDYVVAPTVAGREECLIRSRESRYHGAIPVSLACYTALVHRQRPKVVIDRERLTNALSDLVVSPEMIEAFGPAVLSEGAVFLYGPPGTGKTSLATRVVRALDDAILVPYALAVDGYVITIFDPTVHEMVDAPPNADSDPRFVWCKRPSVITGGELQLEMLDLHFDRDSGVYQAPLQLKANNGVLIIDDFGRQTVHPSALLNRWIVPLDRRVDYLTVAGRKIEVPFELKVVMSTNLDPGELGDDAFFRRVRNKIYVGPVTDDAFDWILSRCAKSASMGCDAVAARRLKDQAREKGDGELRAYLPSLVVEMAQAIITFDGLPSVLTGELVDRVLNLYFTRFDEMDDSKTTFGAAAETETPSGSAVAAPSQAPPQAPAQGPAALTSHRPKPSPQPAQRKAPPAPASAPPPQPAGVEAADAAPRRRAADVAVASGPAPRR